MKTHLSSRLFVKGFTLLELIVALAVFAILMIAVSQIFTSAFSGYRNTRTLQKNLENAQFAMNNIAKSLRTSSVVSPMGTSGTIRFLDYSQNTCFEYRSNATGGPANRGSFEVASVAIPYNSESDEMIDDCENASLTSFESLTAGNARVQFAMTPSLGNQNVAVGSEAKRVGKVTISIEIQEGADHVARIQSTTSLRDYGSIGL